MQLTGKVAIVTGAGSGLGLAAAITLAKNGARVAVCGHSLEGANEAVHAIGGEGGSYEPLGLQLDVEDSNAVDSAIQRTIERFGSVDIVVHAAATNSKCALIDMSDEEWHRIININLTGSFNVLRAAGRQMVEQQRGGTMVFFSSDRGIYGSKNASHYAATKAGVVALVKSAALELGHFGITVNAVNPGSVDTKLTRMFTTAEERQVRQTLDPMGRWRTPDEIADLILFLVSSGGRYITGQLFTAMLRST